MAKTVALIFGIVYTLVGILGFVPSLTAGGTLLGFPINTLDNIVHLIIGVAGLVMARAEGNAATYCKIFGVVLLFLGLLGFVTPNFFGLIPIGGRDIALHLISGAILAYAGFTARTTTTAGATI